MEFWRIYRLVYAKRWLIAAIMLITAAVIFVGATLQAQKKRYEAFAFLLPQERALPSVIGNSNSGGGSATLESDDRAARISNLIVLMRNTGDLHAKAAELLRLPENERAARVQQILKRNGTFVQTDTAVENEIKRQVEAGLIDRKDVSARINKDQAALREALTDNIAKARDDAGAFAERGVPLPVETITEQIRRYLSFNPVAGPLASETRPDFANLVQVQAVFPRAAAARLYANMLCVAFVDYYADKSLGAIGAQKTQLEDMKERAEQKLTNAQNQLVTYQKNNDVALTAEQNTAIANAVAYENKRNDLLQIAKSSQAAVNQYQQLLAEEEKQQTDVLPSYESPDLRTLERAVSEARIVFDRVNASNKGVESFEYKEAKAALNAAIKERDRIKAIPFTTTRRNAIRDLLRTQSNAAQVELQRSQSQLAEVEQQLREEKAKMARLPDAKARLAELQRAVSLNTESVAALEKELRDADLRTVDENSAGTIAIDPARINDTDTRTSSRWMLMAYGAVLAMIFGVALVVAMDALDNSVRNADDVEKLLGLPIAGVIPAQLPDPDRAPRITYLDPLSPVAESYRLLRTDLLFTAEERPFKSLMVSTGKPGQGATTTICNLAIALAQAGKRVILVDADLRRPKLHNIFKVKNDVGLTSLLNNECEIEEALKATDVDNLLLLPSGPLPLNPSELLSSPRMRALHEQLKPHTDFILFDTPSAIAFSDASVLSSFLDATLMVVRANNVPRGSEQQVKTMLSKARANIIGVVLNGMNPEHVDSVHYHYHYYPVLAAKRGALNGMNGSNGNGHHGGDLPLSLPGEGGNGEPVTTRAAAATAAEGQPAASGVPDSSLATEKTQTFASPVKKTAVPEPFLEERKRSLWGRVKGAVPYILLAVAIGLLVLLVQSSVSGPK